MFLILQMLNPGKHSVFVNHCYRTMLLVHYMIYTGNTHTHTYIYSYIDKSISSTHARTHTHTHSHTHTQICIFQCGWTPASPFVTPTMSLLSLKLSTNKPFLFMRFSPQQESLGCCSVFYFQVRSFLGTDMRILDMINVGYIVPWDAII